MALPIYASGEKLAAGEQVVKLTIDKESFSLLSNHALIVQRYLDKGRKESALAVARANALREAKSVDELRTESAPTFEATKGMTSTASLVGKDERKRPEKSKDL